MLFFQCVSRDAIAFLRIRVQADPNGAHLSDLSVPRSFKFSPVLGGNQPADIVYSAFDQWVSWIVPVLRFHVYDDPHQRSVSRRQRMKPNIVVDPAFRHQRIFCVHPGDRCAFRHLAVRLVGIDARFSHRGDPLDIFFRDRRYVAIPVFIQAVFQDPRKKYLVRKQAFATRVVQRLFLRQRDIARHPRSPLHAHSPLPLFPSLF